MNVEAGAQLATIVSVLIVGGGIIFGLGRLTERVQSLREEMRKRDVAVTGALSDIKAAMFGVNGGEGIFVRRSELQLMIEKAGGEHAAFDTRLHEQAKELGAIEAALDDVRVKLARIEGAA